MKESPIIFTEPMIRAILDGRKTQTRRIVESQSADKPTVLSLAACPYGGVGDRIWVKEKWKIGAWDSEHEEFWLNYFDGPDCKARKVPEELSKSFNALWEESCKDLEKRGYFPDEDGEYEWDMDNPPFRWRSPLHMWRWASRITLEITNVRLQQLNGITKNDAVAEGCSDECSHNPVGWFMETWKGLGKKYTALPNPWVYAISFKRIEL
jgi:hypothetical protein